MIAKRILAVCGMMAVLIGATAARADSFSDAKSMIESQAPNLNYGSLCAQQPSGDDKIGCQLKKYTDIGFLVCKKPDYDGVSCENIIKEEINNLSKVKKAGLGTVNYKSDVIGPVKCADNAAKTCYGYLAQWVTDAKFANIDDTIMKNGEVAVLANELVQYIKPSNHATTRSDLEKIRSFMNPGGGKFSRICDLQGFFLKNGGFVISDVPMLVLNSTNTQAGSERDCLAGSHSGGQSPSFTKTYDGIKELSDKIK